LAGLCLNQNNQVDILEIIQDYSGIMASVYLITFKCHQRLLITSSLTFRICISACKLSSCYPYV